MVFHWSLSDSKSPQVSRSLLSILAVLNKAVVWMVTTRPLMNGPKNGPKYLTRRKALVFIPLIRFLLYSFVSSSFLGLLKYCFLIFSFISSCLMVSAASILKYLQVSFSPSVLTLSWFGSSIPSVRCRLLLFITSRCIFLSQIPFLYPDYIFWLCVLKFSILFNF